MATQIKNAIQELRRLRSIPKDEDSGDGYLQKLMEIHEKDICRYRSQEKFTVYLVKGLHEYDTHYEDLESLETWLDLCEANEILDEGYPITIELKRMTGRELGRLDTYDE